MRLTTCEIMIAQARHVCLFHAFGHYGVLDGADYYRLPRAVSRYVAGSLYGSHAESSSQSQRALLGSRIKGRLVRRVAIKTRHFASLMPSSKQLVKVSFPVTCTQSLLIRVGFTEAFCFISGYAPSGSDGEGGGIRIFYLIR